MFSKFRDSNYQNFINLNNLFKIFQSQVNAIKYFKNEFDMSDPEISELIESTIQNIVKFGNDSVAFIRKEYKSNQDNE